MYIQRALESDIHKSLLRFPVTAILGPRQCGKSTLAKHIMKQKSRDTLIASIPEAIDFIKRYFFENA